MKTKLGGTRGHTVATAIQALVPDKQTPNVVVVGAGADNINMKTTDVIGAGGTSVNGGDIDHGYRHGVRRPDMVGTAKVAFDEATRRAKSQVANFTSIAGMHLGFNSALGAHTP